MGKSKKVVESMGCRSWWVGRIVRDLNVIRKYHRLRGLNNRHLFLMVLEAEKSKVEVPVHCVPGEDSLPGKQTACLLARC